MARSRRAAWVAVAVGASLAALCSGDGAAQQEVEPTLADVALLWAEGDFGTPLICQIDGQPVRGLRRISIAPPPRPARPPAARISFADLEAGKATRCFTELAGEVPNVVGWVDIRLPGKYRAETAQRDFREALRRKRGFEYDIVGGTLGIQPVTQPPSDVRHVRFRGGVARLTQLVAGSDQARLLGDFPGPRKLLLELEARDGTTLSFPLYVPKPR